MKTIYLVTEIGNGIHQAFEEYNNAQSYVLDQEFPDSFEIIEITLS